MREVGAEEVAGVRSEDRCKLLGCAVADDAAAALATLTELRRVDGPAHMAGMGQRLRDGLAERALHHGLRIDQSGPVQMPTLLFADDPEHAKGEAFCAQVLRHGAYMHPRHNMFLSCAHEAADIDLVLAAADAGFRHVAR